MHKEREIELYSYFESTQITKGDWINKTKETSVTIQTMKKIKVTIQTMKKIKCKK